MRVRVLDVVADGEVLPLHVGAVQVGRWGLDAEVRVGRMAVFALGRGFWRRSSRWCGRRGRRGRRGRSRSTGRGRLASVQGLAGNAIVVGVEAVGVLLRSALLFEEALCLLLAGEIRAIPVRRRAPVPVPSVWGLLCPGRAPTPQAQVGLAGLRDELREEVRVLDVRRDGELLCVPSEASRALKKTPSDIQR